MPDGPKDAGADVPAEGDAGAGDARHDAVDHPDGPK